MRYITSVVNLKINTILAGFFLLLIFHTSVYADKYTAILSDPHITGSMLWEDATGVHAYPNWTEGQKSDLMQRLEGLESGADFPIEHPPELTQDLYFSEANAWMIYLTHVAHSLWLDVNSVVNWRLADFTEYELQYLLDSRCLMTRHYVPDQYYFDTFHGLGRVTDWNVQFSYDFMKMHDYIKEDQYSTVMAFSSWCRKFVHHIEGTYFNADGYEILYGYRGYPRVDRILVPLEETWGHISSGCWGTTGLFGAVMRSVNIPVVPAGSIWSAPGIAPGGHSRIELPSLGIGLFHSDDFYNGYFRDVGSVIPIDSIFIDLDWIQLYVFDPPVYDVGPNYTNTKYDQIWYNAEKYYMNLIVRHLPNLLLYQRAGYSSENDPPVRLDSILIGPRINGAFCQFAFPYFTEPERRDIIDRVDAAIRAEVNGDWAAGAAIVIERYWAPYVKDNPVPSALAAVDTTSGALPFSVKFTDNSTGIITSWLWDFGDGQTSTDQHPSHTYNQAGSYSVILTVSGPAGTSSDTLSQVILVSEPTGVSQNVISIPLEFAVLPNFPNPFNPETQFSFGLPEAALVRITAYDIRGRLAAVILNGGIEAGYHHVVWNAADKSSGTYIIEFKTDKSRMWLKCVLLK